MNLCSNIIADIILKEEKNHDRLNKIPHFTQSYHDFFLFLDDDNQPAMHFGTTQKGLRRVRSTEFWLEDEHINKAMSILRKIYKDIDGFQDVCVIETGMAKTMRDPWIQIFNKDGNHWITATTVGCDVGVVRIYDSLYRQVPVALVQLIHKLTNSRYSRLVIELPKFQKQRTNHDCGLFAIASMVDLCRGQDPSLSGYDRNFMRPHLVDCLKRGILLDFPEYRGHIDRLKFTNFVYYICEVCSNITECDSSPSICSRCNNSLSF